MVMMVMGLRCGRVVAHHGGGLLTAAAAAAAVMVMMPVVVMVVVAAARAATIARVFGGRGHFEATTATLHLTTARQLLLLLHHERVRVLWPIEKFELGIVSK
jgi:hypothetical protein